MQSKLLELVLKNKALFWDISETDYSSLDEEAIIERLMAYGDMQDIHSLESILSGERLWNTYRRIRSKERVNLEPETINFFDIYLSRYAS